MAIKLYKSQLTPTAADSNVADTRQINLGEAQSIGKAMKGMLQSGENLYIKHLDIKSDNELIEKSKEIMNGKGDNEGLSATIIKAKEMKDDKAALKLYNDKWKSLLDSSKNEVSWMTKKKLSNFMNKQQLKDTNAIKVSTTTNMINGLRLNYSDQIEVWKKSIVYGETAMEKAAATSDLAKFLESNKAKEVFGDGLDKLKKDTNRDIAFFGYKNVAIADQKKALEAAKKDKRLDIEDVEKLKTAFKTGNATSNNLNKDNVKKMESALEAGIMYDQDQWNTAYQIAFDGNDEKTLLKLKNMAEDGELYSQLSTMSVSDIENRRNILQEYANKKMREGKGVELNFARNLEITKKYLSKLNTNLNKDQLATAHTQGIITLNEIGFDKMLSPGGSIEEFASSITERIAQAKSVANFYKRDVKFFTANEEKQISDAFAAADNKDELIQLSTILVKAFGTDSDLAFKQLTKNNTILSTIGGLTIMNDYEPSENVNLIAEGFLISKNKQLAGIYKIKTTDTGYLSAVAKYQKTFLHNEDTFNNIVQAANYIYMAQLRNDGKTTNDFKAGDWEKAFIMASGGTNADYNIMGNNFTLTGMGGYDNDTRGNQVHIPPWLKNGNFGDVVERLKSDENLWLKSSVLESNAIIGDGVMKGEEITLAEIFKEDDPYFVSIGNGKYRIAMGEDPTEPGAEAEYLMNKDGGYFIININKIRDEIITGMN
ncbi:MAG: hypothetical protein CMI81_03755 [Candidatus Pelagibacter sp.]|nr:hypothetical protein [Candidatus Pelagibacter sp.]OUV96601.1 MAG: hypothetical protein CBD02_04765 [Candidatus Pelagibacter sp. TMED142]|tara:strand:+ start:709 stop:2847 length:2139 start_codon:yes stop_codon:yes gene_type:complete